MSTARRFIGAASNLVQFFPLSLFATYAFWRGVPTNQRWLMAFELAALAAVIQLLILLPQGRPMNRLILGANVYLLIGGAAALARQWWVLDVYSVLRESAIFLGMLGVGCRDLSTVGGLRAVADAPRRKSGDVVVAARGPRSSLHDAVRSRHSHVGGRRSVIALARCSGPGSRVRVRATRTARGEAPPNSVRGVA